MLFPWSKGDIWGNNVLLGGGGSGVNPKIPGLVYVDFTQFTETLNTTGADTVGSYNVNVTVSGTSPVITFDSNGMRQSSGTLTSVIAFDNVELDPNWDGSQGGIMVLVVEAYSATVAPYMTDAAHASVFSWAVGHRCASGAGTATQKYNNGWQADNTGGTGRTLANSDLVAVASYARGTFIAVNDNDITLPNPLDMEGFSDWNNQVHLDDQATNFATGNIFTSAHPWRGSVISLENGSATGNVTGMYLYDRARCPALIYDQVNA